MTRVRLKNAIHEIGGTLYEVEIRPSHHEEGTVRKRSHRSHPYDGEASEAQKEHRQRFREAIAYAKVALAEPAVRLNYEKRTAEERRTPFRVAFSDYMYGKDLLSR
jgi:hypothetical protein